MPSLVIVNPAAGAGNGARIGRRVSQLVAGRPDWECVTTRYPGHARHLAASASRANYARIISVGGDGTTSEVASGLANSQTVLAVIPAGTGNDCARNLGVPDDPVSAAHLAITGEARSVDAGEVQTASGTRYFLNVAGFGFDAEAAERVNALPKKFLPGTAPFVVAVLQTLWRFRAPRIRISLDEQAIEQTVFLVAVANCPTYGGGMQIAPDATWDDGLFDVCVVGEISRLEVLRLVPKIYSGGHRGHPAVQFFRCRTLRAESASAVRCQADGELVGSLPATFTIHPGSVQCVTGLQY